jgi:hypothetical protein
MAQKNQKVFVKGADGEERELALLRVAGETAYVCPPSRYREAIEHPEANIEVGFPIGDVRFAN